MLIGSWSGEGPSNLRAIRRAQDRLLRRLRTRRADTAGARMGRGVYAIFARSATFGGDNGVDMIRGVLESWRLIPCGVCETVLKGRVVVLV